MNNKNKEEISLSEIKSLLDETKEDLNQNSSSEPVEELCEGELSLSEIATLLPKTKTKEDISSNKEKAYLESIKVENNIREYIPYTKEHNTYIEEIQTELSLSEIKALLPKSGDEQFIDYQSIFGHTTNKPQDPTPTLSNYDNQDNYINQSTSNPVTNKTHTKENKFLERHYCSILSFYPYRLINKTNPKNKKEWQTFLELNNYLTQVQKDINNSNKTRNLDKDYLLNKITFFLNTSIYIGWNRERHVMNYLENINNLIKVVRATNYQDKVGLIDLQVIIDKKVEHVQVKGFAFKYSTLHDKAKQTLKDRNIHTIFIDTETNKIELTNELTTLLNKPLTTP